MTDSEVATAHQEFAEALAAARSSRGLSQAKFAGRIDFSPGFVGLVETGRRRASDKFLEKAASVLDLDPSSLKEARDLADSKSQVERHSQETAQGLLVWLEQRLGEEVDRSAAAHLMPAADRSAAAHWMSGVGEPLPKFGLVGTSLMSVISGPGRKTRKQRLLAELFDKADSLKAKDLDKVIAYIEGLTARSAKE